MPRLPITWTADAATSQDVGDRRDQGSDGNPGGQGQVDDGAVGMN
jgi:hypothetical protein